MSNVTTAQLVKRVNEASRRLRDLVAPHSQHEFEQRLRAFMLAMLELAMAEDEDQGV